MTKEEALRRFQQQYIVLMYGENQDKQCKMLFLEDAIKMVQEIDEPYWHTEEPIEEGEYLVEFSNGSHTVAELDRTTEETAFKHILPMHSLIAYTKWSECKWHKIPPYEEKK